MGKQVGIVTQSPFDEKAIERLVDCVYTKGGLAVHQYPSGVLNNWTITHIPSGLAVAKGGETQVAAMAAFEELLPLTDWSQDQQKLAPADLRKQVREIIRRHGMIRMTDEHRPA